MYCVAALTRGPLRSLTILLSPLEGEVVELKPCAVIGSPSKLSLLEPSSHSVGFALITHACSVEMAE